VSATPPVDPASFPPQPAPGAAGVEGTLPPQRAPGAGLAERHARQRRLLALTATASLALHLTAFAAWAFLPSRARPAVDIDEAVVRTRLVKLGKPRDEKLLPRLPTAPPPAPTQAPPSPEPPRPDSKPTPAQPPAERPSAADILDRFKTENQQKSLKDLIQNRIGEDSDEGQQHGDKDGSALDGEITQSYFARLTARIQNAMQVSSVLTDEEKLRLRAELCLKVGEDGTVSDVRVKQSGSPVFDADVTAAARRASPLPAPPPPARARAAAGICVEVCPLKCS
jgi:TonB family protein